MPLLLKGKIKNINFYKDAGISKYYIKNLLNGSIITCKRTQEIKKWLIKLIWKLYKNINSIFLDYKLRLN